jgi:uncharacterized protein (TIGR02231 family)
VATDAQSSFIAANSTFDKQNEAWFYNNYTSQVLQKDYLGNRAALGDNVKRVEQLFATLHERGTTAHFLAPGEQTVRTDGRPTRVLLSQADLSAQHRILAAPELTLNAAHTVDLTNTSKQAVLPGKVSVYLDGAFLGLTESDFVAPSESFSLYLGVADEIKVSRTLDKKRSELKRSGQRTRVLASFLMSVENLSDRPALVQLADRIPVSETDEVKVSGVKITPEVKPDVKGLLRWDVSLGAKQTREFRVEYAIEYPNDLTQRQFSKEAVTEGMKSGRMAAPLPASDLHDQIRQLERRF